MRVGGNIEREIVVEVLHGVNGIKQIGFANEHGLGTHVTIKSELPSIDVGEADLWGNTRISLWDLLSLSCLFDFQMQMSNRQMAFKGEATARDVSVGVIIREMVFKVGHWVRSLQLEKGRGPVIEPWGTPDFGGGEVKEEKAKRWGSVHWER